MLRATRASRRHSAGESWTDRNAEGLAGEGASASWRDTARTMSRENVEIVRSAVDAFNRRDLNALAAACTEDFEFISVLAAIDSEDATYRGATAWADYFADMDEMWEGWQVEDLRIFDAGGDRTACLFRLVGEGRLSGVRVERAVGITQHLRDGKLWRVRSYPNPAEALEAVGLSE